MGATLRASDLEVMGKDWEGRRGLMGRKRNPGAASSIAKSEPESWQKGERPTLQVLTRWSLDWGVCSAHWQLATHVFEIKVLWKPHGWSLVSIGWRVNARRGNRFWKFAWAEGRGRGREHQKVFVFKVHQIVKLHSLCLRSVRLWSCTVCSNAVFVHQGKLKYSRGGGCKAKEGTRHTSFSNDNSCA